MAVVADEMEEQWVETMLNRITTWNEFETASSMKTDVLSWGQYNLRGRLTLRKDHHDYPHLFYKDAETWAVVEISDNYHISSSFRLHVYAAINVTQERWCILTANSHTLLHLL